MHEPSGVRSLRVWLRGQVMHSSAAVCGPVRARAEQLPSIPGTSTVLVWMPSSGCPRSAPSERCRMSTGNASACLALPEDPEATHAPAPHAFAVPLGSSGIVAALMTLPGAAFGWITNCYRRLTEGFTAICRVNVEWHLCI